MNRSLYTAFVSRFLFPLHELVKGHSTTSVLREMEQTQWWDNDKLERMRVERLREFLRSVEQTVPYYRALFENHDFDPRRLESIADLQQLPLLTKSDIRANEDTLRSIKAQGLARFNTGGSSGEPLIFWIGKERVSHDVAAKWRATRWWGVDIGDPEIVVWGSPIELGSQDRARQLRDRVLRTRLLPAFEMSRAKVESFVHDIRKIKPKMLFGYPSSLALIADHAERKHQRMDDLGIKVAFVTSERLYDYQRGQIERVFGCPVANGYGGRDAGFIAHQCPFGGMHITAEDIIVEVVDEHGAALPPGRAGEVVVTHLATRDFPFIRYRTGDVAVLDDKPCACGRGLPLLREIQGRTTDFVFAKDGTVMHGLALIYVIRDVPGVQTFRIIQEGLDRTRILLVTDNSFQEKNLVAIQKGIQARLGQDVDVIVERVDEIPAEASGKFRYVVSHVDNEQIAYY